jgi:hypothetical protein
MLFGNDGDNDNENGTDQMETESTNKDGKSSPKKRKVGDRGMRDSAMDWHTTDNHRTYKVVFVAISQPDIGSYHDTLGFLNGFKPGFGTWFNGQSRLANFRYFPECISFIVGCPLGLVRDLRNYTWQTRCN